MGIAATRPEDRNLWGDEGTFVAMTASLVRDGDLMFDPPDLQFLEEHVDEPAPTVILQQTRRGTTYSKPLLYPLISAPLFALLGEPGLIATNILALALALGLAWIYLRQLDSASSPLWTLATFVCGSVVLVYIGWKMSDLVLLSLTLIGLLLALGGRRLGDGASEVTMPFGGQTAAILGGLALGAVTSMRFTSAALAAAATVALLLDKRWRRGLVVGALAVAGFLMVSGVTVAFLGTANPYKAMRSSFDQTTGYPAGDTLEQASERFTTRPATQSASWRPPLDLRRTAYSTVYFFVGRHTGALIYFPAVIALLLAQLRRPDRVSAALLAGVLAILGFYLIWMPQNYFGGSTFVGNRYFLGAFPALLVGVSRLPSRRSLALVWMIALVAWGSAFYSARTVQGLDHSSQIHAHAGLFRRLPFESTAQRIDGLADRFWSGDFVRFLDPFATPASRSFRLDADRPTAEILIATDWTDKPFYFVVAPDSADVSMSVEGGDGWDRFFLPQDAPGPPGVLSMPFSRPWRRHAYWWKPGKIYDSQLLRFSLESEAGESATAVVRYAGKGRELAPLIAELMGVEPFPPVEASTGGESHVVVKIRNTGRRPWQLAGLFPVRLGFRVVAGNRGQIVTQGGADFPSNVAPGSTVEVPLIVRWPDRPGTYQLAIDLLREPKEALGSLGRRVLVVERIEVRSPISPDSPRP